MAVTTTYPGVYVQEVASGVRTISGVSTSTLMAIGMMSKGILNRPTRVLNYTDYARRFVGSPDVGEMSHQVRQFFQNGGSQAFVMRIANGAREAEVILHDENAGKEVLRLTAKDAGVDGNAIRVHVDYDTDQPESTFNLRAFRVAPDGQGGLREEEEDTFRDLTMNPDSARFAETVVTQESALINATRGADVGDPTDPTVQPDTAIAPFQGYALAGRLFDDEADLQGAIHAAIAAAATSAGAPGMFSVAVDRGPVMDVTIAVADIGATDPAGDLAAAINNEHLALGVTVTASLETGPAAEGGNKQYLRVRSDVAGGAVAFRSATSSDVAAELGLGLANGGLEVDGYARMRPAPNGLFFKLGDLDASVSPPVGALTAFAELDQAAVNGYTLDDVSGSYSNSVLLGATGSRMYEGAGGVSSLTEVKNRLQLFASKVVVDAEGNNAFQWTAAVHGYRLVFEPSAGPANATALSFSSATHDLGGASNGLHAPNTRHYALGASGTSPYQAGEVDGFNGTIPGTGDYRDAFVIVDRDVDLFNLLILPRADGQSDAARANLWGPASAFCQRQRAFLLMDPPSKWGDVNAADAGINAFRVGLVKDHAALYWPRLRVATNGTFRHIDPSGAIAGLMARIDTTRGVWKAPAGTEATITGVRGVEHTLSDGENGVVNGRAVNAIRVFPDGVVSWGARTMDGYDNSGNDDYRYVPVRRTALFIEESLYRGLKWVVFEPNAEPLWAQIRLNVGAFMHNLFRQGAFKGVTPRDAYFVKCDDETTTQNDINLGRVNIWVGFAPLKPAEFVILYLQQMAGQIQT